MARRILCKLKAHPEKFILLAAIYTVIFFAVFLVAGVYISADRQADYLEKYVGNKVVVRKYMTYEDYRMETGLEGADINDLTRSEYVADSEVSISSPKKVLGIEPYFPEGVTEESEEERYAEANVMGTYESESAPLFTKQGGYLVEGRHIHREDDCTPVAMVSRELAEKNELKIGDKLPVEWDIYNQEFYGYTQEGTFEICGIFDYPKVEKVKVVRELQDWLYHPANLIILPVKALQESFEWEKAQDVTVYLKDHQDIPAYMKEMNEKMFTGGEYNTEYTYEWEKDWQESLAKPLLETKKQSGVLLVILIVSMGIAVVLLAALSMRKKKEEIEILTALGERKFKICLQNIIEEMIPVLIALVIVSFVGNVFVDRVGKNMTEENITVTNEINQNETELLMWEYENLYLDTTANWQLSSAGNMSQIQGDMRVPEAGVLVFAGVVQVFVIVIVALQAISMGRKAMRRDEYE